MSELKAGDRIHNWTVKHKPCAVCGAEFLATSMRCKYCATCATQRKKEHAAKHYTPKYKDGRKCDGCGEVTPKALCRWCSECREKRRVERYNRENKERREKKAVWLKIKRYGYVTPSHVEAICYVCKKPFLATFRQSRVGERCACTKCQKEFQNNHPSKKTYAERMREPIRARHRALYAANPEFYLQRAREATKGRKCVICGTPFKAKYYGSSGKVCSKKCKVEHWKRTMKSRDHKCRHCGVAIKRDSVNPRVCVNCKTERATRTTKIRNARKAPMVAAKGKEWRDKLAPEYVANLLAAGTKLNRAEIPPEIIEWKTMQLRLLRSVGAFGTKKSKYSK